jgi:LuxR family maltose regulon positive regulatory protein
LLATVAGTGGDYVAMAARAAGAEAAARSGGWESAPLATAATWMLAYGALMRAEPAEASRLAGAALRRGGIALRPRYVFALRALQGAALFDSGQRHRGLQEMQRARADLGTVQLSHEQAAVLAVLEHHAAATLGQSEAARDVVAWLAERIGARGEILLMRAWAEQSAGRDPVVGAMVGPVLDGTVTSVLAHTIVEALLVEASSKVAGGDVRTARRALRDALSSGASLGVVRPFATAAAQARELLAGHIGGTGANQQFAARALAAGHRPDIRTARLDDCELQLLARLPSALSVAEIARELRIPQMETSTRIHAVYRKLGASSRRTAVSEAHERGLLP